jgi:hypothetical protein
MKTTLAILAALALAFTAAETAPAAAAGPAMMAKKPQCKDAAGKFVKCPAPAATDNKGPCKDDKGRFTKCPAAAPAPKGPCKDAKGKFVKCDAAAPKKG